MTWTPTQGIRSTHLGYYLHLFAQDSEHSLCGLSKTREALGLQPNEVCQICADALSASRRYPEAKSFRLCLITPEDVAHAVVLAEEDVVLCSAPGGDSVVLAVRIDTGDSRFYVPTLRPSKILDPAPCPECARLERENPQRRPPPPLLAVSNA